MRAAVSGASNLCRTPASRARASRRRRSRSYEDRRTRRLMYRRRVGRRGRHVDDQVTTVALPRALYRPRPGPRPLSAATGGRRWHFAPISAAARSDGTPRLIRRAGRAAARPAPPDLDVEVERRPAWSDLGSGPAALRSRIGGKRLRSCPRPRAAHGQRRNRPAGHRVQRGRDLDFESIAVAAPPSPLRGRQSIPTMAAFRCVTCPPGHRASSLRRDPPPCVEAEISTTRPRDLGDLHDLLRGLVDR